MLASDYTAEQRQHAATDACAEFGAHNNPATAMSERELHQRVDSWNAARRKADEEAAAAARAAVEDEERARAEEYDHLLQKVRKLPAAKMREFIEEFGDEGGDMQEMIKRLHDLEVDDDPLAHLSAEARALLTADGEAPTLLIGSRVALLGLQGRPKLNGRRGVCVSFIKGKGRCAVRLDEEAQAEEAAGAPPLALKPCNLRRLSPR